MVKYKSDIYTIAYYEGARRITTYNVDLGGSIIAELSDGSRQTFGHLSAFSFTRPELLKKRGSGCYSGAAEAGLQPVTFTGEWNTGCLKQGCLEPANIPSDVRNKRASLFWDHQMSVTSTGRPYDLAMVGLGYFKVRDPISGACFVTRDGSFTLDLEGHLITRTGLRVQGFIDDAFKVIGDIKVDANFKPPWAQPDATIESSRIDLDGVILVRLSDHTTYARCKVLLFLFQEPFLLKPEPDRLLSNLAAAQEIPYASASAISFAGQIKSGAWELPLAHLPDLTPQAGIENPRLKILGPANEIWMIQKSSDLATWVEVGEIITFDEEQEWFDSSSDSSSNNFHRLVPQ